MSASDSDLVREIRKLTERLNLGDVTFFEVMLAMSQQPLSTDAGKPHATEQPKVVAALDRLIEALGGSFVEHFPAQFTRMSGVLGNGVASGEFGPRFFSRIVNH